MSCLRTTILPKEISRNNLKIISWNVAGLRSVLKNNLNIFNDILERYQPDIICLQETKLQVTNENEFNNILPTYQKYWSSSIKKKGYSGTAIFVKGDNKKNIELEVKVQNTITSMWNQNKRKRKQSKKGAKEQEQEEVVEEEEKQPEKIAKQESNNEQNEESKITNITPTEVTSTSTTTTPTTSTTEVTSTEKLHPLTVLNVEYELKDDKFSGEGRTITIEFPDFYLVNCYVPNSGQKLERLTYRTEEWDPYFFSYLKSLESTGKPVILTGDLNVAHLDLDIHNPTAKHISKQSGLTPQERQSFDTRLAAEFQDALRYFYPNHEGQFTWWSIRTNGRAENKGLRLDYFVCSKGMFLPNENQEEINHENDNNNESKSSSQERYRAIVRDSNILHEFGIGSSDHCPISLTLEILQN